MEFDEFVMANLPSLTKLAGVLTGDEQAAHDLLVDLLVKLASKWGPVRAARDPLAYVRKSLVRQYLDDRRRGNSARRRDQTLSRMPLHHTSDPVRQIDDRDMLNRALASLTPQQRGALVLRHYLDLPDQQVAELLNCSISTVRTHLSLGAARLRRNESLLSGKDHS
ncbi:sigma-70 family RNA polymerase sigma factor [Nakamurella silvestris]|nr:sigma-70 family RNA polymerase sigma factor [Nakamurella silvestris]